MRIATYNVEWFTGLFDDEDQLLLDDGWSARHNITRAQQAQALGTVFCAMDDSDFASLRARFVPDTSPLPHAVLGIPPNASLEEGRAAWRKLVRANHPDALVARGLPQEAIAMAEKRMIDINRAWETWSGKAQ